jgi:hypothetical protein
MKKLILVLTIFLSLSRTYSQEKTTYEYGIIIYATAQSSNKKYVIIENIQNQVKSEEGKLEDGLAWTNFLPITNRLEELSKDGWEHYLTTPNITGGGTAAGTLFFIRRKKA